MSNDSAALDALWSTLRQHTSARIGLGHTGVSLSTQHHLNFQLAHARARDAVHVPLDVAQLQADLSPSGATSPILHSRARDRQQFLQRPDLGRRLHPDSALAVKTWAGERAPCDAAIVVVDGLSSTGVQRHAPEVAHRIRDTLERLTLSATPPVIALQGRVAIGDEIGELLESKLLIMLIGERPGLSSPDSLGIYYTFRPAVGMNDAHRNCISNIRPKGLGYDAAVAKLTWLIEESIARNMSGVLLKERSGESTPIEHRGVANFLLG